MTSLPADMELIGGQRAFILYDRSLFESDDDLQYRRFLRDLEIKGRVAKYFLPESNYALCKLRSKRFRCNVTLSPNLLQQFQFACDNLSRKLTRAVLLVRVKIGMLPLW